MEDNISFQVRRFNPDNYNGSNGYFQTYYIPKNMIDGMTIITALSYIQEKVDHSLTFYYSCELAKCRGCVMLVNGKVVYACTEAIKDDMVIEPIPNLPIIRDLMVKFIESEVYLDEKLCNSCGLCVNECPMGIFELQENKEFVLVRDGRLNSFKEIPDVVDCIGCRKCELICRKKAITITHKK